QKDRRRRTARKPDGGGSMFSWDSWWGCFFGTGSCGRRSAASDAGGACSKGRGVGGGRVREGERAPFQPGEFIGLPIAGPYGAGRASGGFLQRGDVTVEQQDVAPVLVPERELIPTAAARPSGGRPAAVGIR